MLDQVTPLTLTFNEAPNIGRNLERLTWARDVVVVDSFSSDDTLAIVNRYANARVVQRKFDEHARQWNFGLKECGIGTDWVLALDADYIITQDLLREIQALAPEADVAGYRVKFIYCIDGQPLRAAVYPPVTVLYRRACAEYYQDGHTQRVRLTGRILDLKNPILHDDRKSFRRWLGSQSRYMRLEAEHLRNVRFSELAIQHKLRKLIVIAPVAILFYCLFVKGNILDRRAGLIYSMQRALAESILSFYLLRALFSRNTGSAVKRSDYERYTTYSVNPFARLAHRIRVRLSVLISEVWVPRGGTLLDFGAGTGLFLDNLGIQRPDLHLNGIEPYMAMQAKNASLAPGFDAIGDASQDVVTAFEVCEHLYDDELNEFYSGTFRVLRTSGNLIISVPIVLGPVVLLKELNRMFSVRKLDYSLAELIEAVRGKDVERAEDLKISHKGFNFRSFASTLEPRFAVQEVIYSPFRHLPWWANSQVFFICSRAPR